MSLKNSHILDNPTTSLRGYLNFVLVTPTGFKPVTF